jgi:hypothetical protein
MEDLMVIINIQLGAAHVKRDRKTASASKWMTLIVVLENFNLSGWESGTAIIT